MRNQIQFLVLVLYIGGTTSLLGQGPAQGGKLDFTADSLKVEEYLRSATAVMFSNPDSALFISNKGLEIARRLNDPILLNQTLMFQGICKGIARRSLEAVALFEEAKKGFLQAGDTILALDAEMNMGLAYYHQGDMEKALECYLNVYQSPLIRMDKSPLGFLLNNIASIYKQQKKYDEALKIYRESQEILVEINDSVGMAATLHNIAGVYLDRKDFELALENQKESLKIYEAIGRMDKVGALSNTLGRILFEMGRLEEALPPFEFAKKYFSGNPNAEHEGEHFLYLGRINLNMGKEEQAIAMFQEGLEFLEGTDKEPAKATFAQYLSQAYASSGRFREAYESLQSVKVTQDSLALQSRVELEEELQKKFEVAQKEYQLELAELQLARQNREKVWYLILLALALFIIGGIFYFLQQRNATNRILREKNKLIEQALKEKELLLREIHHRVKNNLQFISSLLRLQSRRVEGGAARSALEESQSRVQAMSLIHQNLYQDEEPSSVHVKPYFEELFEAIFSAQNIRRDKVQLRQDIAPLKLDIDTVAPMGLIVNELVTNALKHAFSSLQEGQIWVSLKKGVEALELEVADDGKGSKVDFEKEQLDSFGLRLVQLLMQRLQATWEVDSSSGMRFRLLIRNYKLT